MEKRLPLPVGTVLQGRYRILRQLGHGGFGAVYEAIDDELHLAFALKETFYAADEDLRSAFKREARMLARLSHEAFPRVTHYFTEGDGCFLVMELVHGDDLDKLLSHRPVPFETEQILTWADQILDALEDLHSAGIIHRDIKPSNLKLTPKGKIKLLDFGIAKGAVEGETTILTTVGSLAAATLQYAPLEQVLKASEQYQMMLSVVSSDKVGEVILLGTNAASDIYALAATLYHLLTKRLPADAATRALAIWSEQPDRLIPAHQVNPQIPKKVSEILQKAMNLNRKGRYQTAAEMRQAFRETTESPTETRTERFAPVEPAPTQLEPFVKLEDEYEQETQPSSRPFRQQPTTPFDRQEESPPLLALPEKNNKFLYGIAIGLIALLIFGILGYFGLRNSGTANSNIPLSNKNDGLNTNIAISNSTANSKQNNSADAKYELAQTLLSDDSSWVKSVAFSPDGKTIASVSLDEKIILWDAASGTLKQTIANASNSVRSVAFSPDGKMIATGGDDGKIRLWDVTSGALKNSFSGHKDYIFSIVFSPDGKTLASGSADYTVKLWDTASGTLKKTLSGHKGSVYSVAFSPDGSALASGSDDKTVKLWDTISGALKQTFSGHEEYVNAVAFSPDGKMIASAGEDKTVKLWDTASGTFKRTLSGHSHWVYSVAFSPDGSMLASGSDDKTVKLWDAASGILKQTLTGHNNSVSSVVFSPDGKTIASGSADKTIKLWRVKE